MKSFLLLSIFFSLLSCKHRTSQEKEIRDNLKKEINLEMFDNIKCKDKEISFNNFRNKYKYIYLVYLKDGCLPCYPKYVSWQEKMDSINKFDFVTVLFIIKGNSYDKFIDKAQKEGLVEDKFYTFMDSNDTFINANEDIPGWIIESTFLIDDQNQITLIGSPFSTPEMTKVFYGICSNQ